MKTCLLCESMMAHRVVIQDLFTFKGYFEQSLCLKCQAKSNILTICHQKYIEQKDFLMKHCFATIYKPIVDSIKPDLILTYSYSEHALFDETAEIIKAMGYQCYSLKKTTIKNNTIYTKKIDDLSTTLVVVYDKINKDDVYQFTALQHVKFLYILSGELKGRDDDISTN